MAQKALHYSLSDALRAVVDECGGPVVIGKLLRPEYQGREGDARGYVNKRLNEERNEKFSLEELEYLFEMGRKASAHDAIEYLCRRCSYRRPEPIEPEDRQAEIIAAIHERLEDVVELKNDLIRAGLGKVKVVA